MTAPRTRAARDLCFSLGVVETRGVDHETVVADDLRARLPFRCGLGSKRTRPSLFDLVMAGAGSRLGMGGIGGAVENLQERERMRARLGEGRLGSE